MNIFLSTHHSRAQKNENNNLTPRISEHAYTFNIILWFLVSFMLVICQFYLFIFLEVLYVTCRICVKSGRDILMGLMKRLIKYRASNLKVLVTSATLDGEKVSKFFSNCPILNVPGKLFPVEIVNGSELPKSYLEASLRTALGITG